MHNPTDYEALVALDWGDTTHSFAWQKTNEAQLHRGSLPASPEALHEWLEQLREACGGRPVALAIEAGRNGLLHALLEHASWLTIYPIHPATSARFRLAFSPSGAKARRAGRGDYPLAPAPAPRASHALHARHARGTGAGRVGRAAPPRRR